MVDDQLHEKDGSCATGGSKLRPEPNSNSNGGPKLAKLLQLAFRITNLGRRASGLIPLDYIDHSIVFVLLTSSNENVLLRAEKKFFFLNFSKFLSEFFLASRKTFKKLNTVFNYFFKVDHRQMKAHAKKIWFSYCSL